MTNSETQFGDDGKPTDGKETAAPSTTTPPVLPDHIPWEGPAALDLMAAASAEEAAMERAMVPPPTPSITVPDSEPPGKSSVESKDSGFAIARHIEPPIIEPPQQQYMLTEMSAVTAADAGLDKEQQPPKQTAWQKRHGIYPPPPQEVPGPWKAVPPAPQLGVMKEMGEAIEAARPQPKEAGGMPAGDVDRMNFAGAEQEHVMAQRVAGVLESFGRLFDKQLTTIRTLSEMVADHERKLHDIQGFLERSRV